jgi:hypothetical protein
MFVSSIVFANLVDQISLHEQPCSKILKFDALMHFDVLVIIDAFISSTNRP